MNLMERSANAAVHTQLSELARELGEEPYDLALSQIRAYQTALRETRAALADALGRDGHHWQADPGGVRLRMSL